MVDSLVVEPPFQRWAPKRASRFLHVQESDSGSAWGR
jgi:hypothetical protein